MLTWAALNIAGGGEGVAEQVKQAQMEVFRTVDKQVTEWKIEHREADIRTGRRWRADTYLYCVEVTCPECGWCVPLLPSLLVGPTCRAIVNLIPDSARKKYDFEVIEGATDVDIKAAADCGTLKGSELVCPNPN